MKSTILVALGVVLLLAGIAVSLMEWASGAQPWGQLLGDNFIFARTLPFSIGLGIVVGYWKASNARLGTERRGSDDAIRRFAKSTVWLHALAGASVVLLIATGGWQYLKGLLSAETPVYMGTVYRLHYFAASLLIFATVAFLTDWWLRGENGLIPAKGQTIRMLRGLAHELPKPFGTILAYGLGLDLRRPAPPTEQFTFYERLISFPLWELSIGLVMLTGIIKAMRYIYPIPGDVLYWVSAVHVGAGVLLSMKFLDHLRYLLAPSRWPLMAAMASGWIPEGYVRRFFPGWYARLSAQGSAAAVAPTPTPASPAVRSAGGGAS
jgi:hypothetical protein